MDTFTTYHLESWLENHVSEDERDATRFVILDIVENHPDMLETHSWPEIRDLASRLKEQNDKRKA